MVGAGLGAAAAAALGGLLRQFRPPTKGIDEPPEPAYAVHDDQFLRTLGAILPPPLAPGNRVETLRNGNAIFPVMLDAIRAARRTVTMETFIYWRGGVARECAEALAERARAGVACHLMLDWWGSQRMDQRLMRRAGVQVERFHRPGWSMARANHRTHRKLLVVDGRVGFTGGVGIADEWTGDAQDPQHWRDNHYRIEGPVVAQLQSAFSDNWLKSQSTVLHGNDYFPPLEEVGPLRCQAFQSSPDEGSESMRLLFLMGLGAARRSVRIATAYFVPDELTVRALCRARDRGVDIQVIVPGQHIDTPVVRHASRRTWPALLDAGVAIHEYLPTMYHVKAMIVDGYWTSIGSANFDNRSFRLNDEANVNVFDEGFAREQAAWFEHDLTRCRRMTHETLAERPVPTKAVDAAAGLLAGQL